jgi:hypothetical protein
MSYRYLIIGLAASVSVAAPASSAQQIASESDQGLRRFVQNYVRGRSGAGPGETRYASALVDLNGDGRREALVYLVGPDWCGSGGCHLLILTRDRSAWRLVTRTSVTNAPIRVLSTSSRGWRDIGVRVAGGGIRAYEARLIFNGRSYPSNPSLIEPARRQPAGTVVISDDDRGRALFP